MNNNNLSDAEKKGIIDFFSTNSEELTITIARIISKNVLNIDSGEDAINIIIQHSVNAINILNRKAVTKEILFKYLHSKKIQLTDEYTKDLLISRVIEYWNTTYSNETLHSRNSLTPNNTGEISSSSMSQQYQQSIYLQSHVPQLVQNLIIINDNFPIQKMCKTFSKWFFDNLNQNKITVQDFWRDVTCELNYLENRQIVNREQTESPELVLDLLQNIKNKLNIYFNPNCCDNGVQGRMDKYGLVIAIIVGSLHRVDMFCGTFESAFGLLRDPFAENNWKIKHLKLYLNSNSSQNIESSETPQLYDATSVQDFLMLPVNES